MSEKVYLGFTTIRVDHPVGRAKTKVKSKVRKSLGLKPKGSRGLRGKGGKLL